jgi:sulfate permease, SulP family
LAQGLIDLRFVEKMLAGLKPMRLNFSEFSGALADLGVLLPLVLAMISINGVNASGTFFVIGLAYLINAFAYGLPIPVQPLKSFSATALALGLAVPIIIAGSWLMALVFLLLALTGLDRLLARLFPQPVVRGVQLGLGVLLVRSAMNLIFQPDSAWQGDLSLFNVNVPWIFVITTGSLIMLGLFLGYKRDWAALVVVLFGIALAWLHNGFPEAQFTPSLPRVASGLQLKDFWIALGLLVLPQIPLSLANSVYATTDAAQRYFGESAAHVSSSRLLTTMGISNVAAALFGGVPVCHGCGGLTAHYRLGARSGGAPLMLGILFLSIGVFGGGTILPLFELIPFPALGVLLAYVGIQHALLARDLRGWQAWVTAVSVAVIAYITRNLAIGFAGGASIYFGLRTVTAVQKRWSSQRQTIGR